MSFRDTPVHGLPLPCSSRALRLRIGDAEPVKVIASFSILGDLVARVGGEQVAG